MEDKALIQAFLQGAKWWEYETTGATMWQSDQQLVIKEAQRRLRDQTLGKSYDEITRQTEVEK